MPTMRDNIPDGIFNSAYEMQIAVVPGVILAYLLQWIFVGFESISDVAEFVVILFAVAFVWVLLGFLTMGLIAYATAKDE